MNAQPTLATLLDDTAFFSLEHQLHLADLIGEDSWSVDLDIPTFRLSGATPRACGVQLLGSAAPGPQSWLWAWANPGAFPAQTVAVAEQVRTFGEYYGIAVLREPEVPFANLPPDRQDPIGAVAVLTDAAKIISGRWASYNGEAGGGTRAAFLIDHPDFVLGPPEPARIMRVLQQGLAQGLMTDHRRAVYTYAGQRGLSIAASPDWSSATITGPRLNVDITFDDLGRIHKMSATLSGERDGDATEADPAP